MPAIGGSTSTVRDKGLMVVDIRDRGAVEGTSHATAARLAIQAANDYLKANLSANSWGKIYIPNAADAWYVDGPVIIDCNNLIIDGEGPSSFIKAIPQYGGPVFIHGISRTPGGQSLSTDHLPDAFGKLDSSAAPTTGVRYGLHMKAGTPGIRPDSNVVFWSSPFQVGSYVSSVADFWANTRQFTIEWCCDWTGTVTHSGPYFGMSNHYNTPLPWYVFGGDQFLNLYFRTQDGSYDGGKMGGPIWQAFIVPTATSGVRKFVFQVDLINGVVNAAEDQGGVLKQVAVGIQGGAGSFNSAANLHLTSSQNSPFKIGAMGDLGEALGSTYYSYTGTAERTFYGLRIQSGLRYNFPGTGQAITRVDSSTINDATNYFTNTSSVITLLPLTDSPATVASNRLVKCTIGNSSNYTYGFFTSSNHDTLSNPVVGLKLRNLRVESRGPGPYGDAITLGQSIEVSMDHCELRGGCHAVGTPNWASNYIIRLDDCVLWGLDACFYGFFTEVEITRCDAEIQGRTPFWFAGQSTATMDRVTLNGFTALSSPCEHHIRLVQGGMLNCTNIGSDTEGNGPSVSGIYAEDGTGASIGAAVTMSKLNWGTVQADVPFAILHTGQPGQPPNRFDLKGPMKYDSVITGPLVQTDAPNWNGVVETDLTSYESPVFDHRGATATSNLLHVGNGYTVPPYYSKWYAGVHDLYNRAASDGQWTKWRCTGTGRYGTASPPAWQGTDARDEGVNALAAYFTGGSYWSVSGSLQGNWSTYANQTVLNGLFSGSSIPSAPTTVYLGLSAGRALDLGTYYYTEFNDPNHPEYAATNYSRVATSWNASSGGATANTGAITFPTAGANWPAARSLVLWDAATGGNQLAAIELTNPVSVLSGNALSYGIGAITVAPYARTVVRPNAWADGVNDRINNYWLRAASLTPTSVYLALSTAPADPTSSPTEPSGNGYARVQLTTANMPAVAAGIPALIGQRVVNGAVKTFPSPSGSWGTVQSMALMDASTSGNVLASANLPVSRTLTTGSVAPSFAVGSIWIQR